MASCNDLLTNCVGSLQSSIGLLNNSLTLIEDTTKNVPRLESMLTTKKVFGLVPQLDLDHATKTLQDDLQPQIGVLRSKIDQEINRLSRKKTQLNNKIALQKVRLESVKANDHLVNKKRLSAGNISDEKIHRLRLLQNKKNRLKYSLSRVKLQGNKDRLSMGMSPSLPPDESN